MLILVAVWQTISMVKAATFLIETEEASENLQVSSKFNRSTHSKTRDYNQNILDLYSYDECDKCLDKQPDNEVFDLYGGSWLCADCPDQPVNPVPKHQGVLVIGGLDGYQKPAESTTEVFHCNLAVGNLPVGVARAQAAVKGNVVTLCGGADNMHWPQRACYVLRIPEDNGIWKVGPPMKVARCCFQLLYVGEILVAVGGHKINTIEFLEPGKNEWELKFFGREKPIDPERAWFCAADIGNDELLLIGGRYYITPEIKMRSFNIRTGKETPYPPPPFGAIYTCTTSGDSLFIITFDANTHRLDLSTLNLKTLSWTKTPTTVTENRLEPAIAVTNGIIGYYGGNGDYWSDIGSNEYYELINNVWTKKHMQKNRKAPATAVVNC